MSLGSIGSSAGSSLHFPFEERILTGSPLIRFLTLNAINIACLSMESGFPKPNESRGIVRSSGASTSPPVRMGQIHSTDPEESALSSHGRRGCGVA